MASKAAKERAHREQRKLNGFVGRKPKEGPRHPGGKLVQPTPKETERERKATVVAQTAKRLGVSVRAAREIENVSAIGLLSRNSPEHGGLSKEQQKTADDIARVKAAADHAIMVKRPRSASDYGGAGGFDDSIPDKKEAKAMRDMIEKWHQYRHAILESGPFGMMAVEAIVFSNVLVASLVGDLRLALNAVHRVSSQPRA
jgi:hypothetical protein